MHLHCSGCLTASVSIRNVTVLGVTASIIGAGPLPVMGWHYGPVAITEFAPLWSDGFEPTLSRLWDTLVMSTQGENLDRFTADEQALLSCLPQDGTAKGNQAVRLELEWDEDRYFSTRNHLEDGGHVVRGRGRGGSVRRILTSETTPPGVAVPASTVASVAEVEYLDEADLYEPMRKVIAGEWAKDHRADPVAVEITALQGRRSTGGKWSRPDITSVEVRTFSYVPGKFLEVVTFEVKPYYAISVQAVYEALAHRRTGTRAYVLLHVPARITTQIAEVIADIIAVARVHGVGLITAEDPSDYATWEDREDAQRFEPDPERLNEFISVQLTEKAKDAISRRLR